MLNTKYLVRYAKGNTNNKLFLFSFNIFYYF